MAGKTLEELLPIVQQGKNFLLSGGAGSGKTYTLIQILNAIFRDKPKSTVACITFTKVAANEIRSRTPYENLWISTIHEFLWSCISLYQENLKKSLVTLLEMEKSAQGTGIKSEEIYNLEFFKDKKIQYRDYQKLEDGIVSHNAVLKLANYMFKTYPTLSRILKSKYEYILIDEYQDSEKQVIQIFLDYLSEDKYKKNVIGFFGDSMQSIYSQGIGDINNYILNGVVQEVIKNDNYRCSTSVINLLNKVRPSLIQEPSENNKKGSVTFLYSRSAISIANVKNNIVFNNWDFKSEDTKELYLTHRLVAKENDFSEIYDLYAMNNDRLIKEDNQDSLIKHLFKIQEIIYLYTTKSFNEFIKKTDYKLKKLSDKEILKSKIDSLKNFQGKTIEEVIDLADTLNLVKKDDVFIEFINNPEKAEIYNKVKNLKQSQIVNVYNYVKDYSPFSTQHNIKGAEFENVFVVLDNGNWNLYNFEHLFSGTGNERTIERTKKLFYVCCSRAKENLVVYFQNPSVAAIGKAQYWFGVDRVIEIKGSEF